MADIDPDLLREFNEKMNDLTGSFGKARSSTDDYTRSQSAAQAAAKKAAEEEAKWQSVKAQASKSASDAAKQFGTAVMSSSANMTKYSGAITGATAAVSSIVGSFGLLGKGLSLLVNVVGGVTKAVLEQNDAMLKATDTLAEIGASGDLTAAQIRMMGERAQYTRDNLQKWAEITKSAGQALVGFTGTVNGGVKSFAQMTELSDKEIANYRALGISQEALTQNQADYLKLQMLSGISLKQREVADGSLRRATLEYTNQLLDLSALTGKSVDQLKQEQEAALSDLAVQTRISTLDDKAQQLKAQGLDAESKKVELERDSTAKLAALIGVLTKGQEQAGLLSALATGNFNENSKGMAAGYSEVLTFLNQAKKGMRDPYELGIQLSSAMKNIRGFAGEAIIQSKDVATAFGASSETFRLETQYRGKSAEELKKAIEEDRSTRKNVIESGSKDEVQIARSNMERLTRQSQAFVDRVTQMIGSSLTKALNAMVNGLEDMMKAIKGFTFNLVTFADKALGTHMADAFSISDDPRKDLDDLLPKIGKLNEEYKTESARNSKSDRAKSLRSTISDMETRRDQLMREVERSKSGEATSRPSSGTSVSGSTGKAFYNKVYQALFSGASSAGLSNPEVVARLGAAQAAHETGWGKHMPQDSNNFFGMKAVRGQDSVTASTQEWDPAAKKMVSVDAKFRKFASTEEAATAYINFLKHQHRYRGVVSAHTIEEAIAAQGKSGYATDPAYTEKLRKIHQIGVASAPELTGRKSAARTFKTPEAAQLAAASAASAVSSPGSVNSTAESPATVALVDTVSDKLDALINIMTDSRDTQEKLLQYARA